MWNNSVLTGATMHTGGKSLAAHVTELMSIQEMNVGIQKIPLWKRSCTEKLR